MGIPDYLICLLRNLYAGQEATVRTGHGTTDCFQIGKGVRQGCILSPAYVTSMQSTSWEMLGWRKHKLSSGLLGEISVTSGMYVCVYMNIYRCKAGRFFTTEPPGKPICVYMYICVYIRRYVCVYVCVCMNSFIPKDLYTCLKSIGQKT